MSDLEKLKALLQDEESGIKHCCGLTGCNDIDNDIEAIKQAFIDEGWVQLPKTNGEARKLTITYEEKGDGKFDRIKNDTFLSGPEWIARFEKELSEERYVTHVGQFTWRSFAEDDILRAAHRAAGVEE